MAAKASQRPANTQVILQQLQEIDRELYQPGSATSQNPKTRKVVSSTSSSTVVSPEYAGFWRRFAAYLLDRVILGISGFVIGGVLSVPLVFVDLFSYQNEAFIVGGSITGLGGGFLWLIVFTIVIISNYHT